MQSVLNAIASTPSPIKVCGDYAPLFSGTPTLHPVTMCDYSGIIFSWSNSQTMQEIYKEESEVIWNFAPWDNHY